jgi:hypothetical protein
MIDLFFENIEHSLAILVFISRLGDVGTTYLATPNLKLEANPLVRKLRWPFALFGFVLCLVPYYSTALAVVIIVVSLLVSASNGQRLWLLRTIGEDRYYDLLLSAASKAEMPSALAMLLLPGFFMTVLGGLILLFYPDPNFDWGFYVAMGVFLYAFVLLLYGPLSFFRLRRQSAEIED